MKKTALVTGASRGIGKEIAIALAREGYDLYLICHNNINLLQTLSSKLEKEYPITCHTFAGDVSDSAFIHSVFQEIELLDVLINNAGISYIGLLSDMTDAEWQNVIQTNLSSCFYTCREAIPKMLQSHSGKIFNISSVWGNVGASMEVAYSASKGGVNSLTKALAKELAPSNIQVNALALGIIDTDMNKCFSAEELEAIKNEIPADRLGTAKEAADMVISLLHSPSYLTGQIITLDGGWQ